MPLEFQEYLVNTISGFKTERIRTGHSPFLSQPDECARLVVKLMKET
jgi:hypothetical protein